MDSNTQNNVEQQQPAQRIQIYPPITTGVSPFWRGALSFFFFLSAQFLAYINSIHVPLNTMFCFTDKYERDAKKYWDQFYRRHQDRVSSLAIFSPFYSYCHYCCVITLMQYQHYQAPEFGLPIKCFCLVMSNGIIDIASFSDTKHLRHS